MQGHDDNDINFDGIILTVDCDVCTVGKSHQLVHPKKAQHAGIIARFQLCYGDLMRPFTPGAYEGFQCESKITNQFTKWTTVYLLANKNLTFKYVLLFITLVVIPCGGHVIR